MDVFIDQFNRANFPIGSRFILGYDTYTIEVPNTGIEITEEDPLVAVEKAKAKLDELRSTPYED